MSTPKEGQYAKLQTGPLKWAVVEWNERSVGDHEGYWATVAHVENETTADKIVRCRNRALEGEASEPPWDPPNEVQTGVGYIAPDTENT